MKHRYAAKRAVKILSLLLAVALAVAAAQEFWFRDLDPDSLRIEGFYGEPEDSLDVVLIGQSSVYTGYSPAYAYAQAGYTSYSLAISSNTVSTWKTLTEEALKRQSPQLLVVDVGGMHYMDETYNYRPLVIHRMVDNMPLSETKREAVERCVVNGSGEDPLGYYVPFTFYHSRWVDAWTDKVRVANTILWRLVSRNILRGNYAHTRVVPTREVQIDVREDYTTSEVLPENEAYLREYLTYCREQGLNVLFVSLPSRVTEAGQSYGDFCRQNRAGEIIAQYGFDYINFAHAADEIGIDFATDFYDDGHMNFSGQRKFTAYFSRFLTDEYGVAPREQTESQRSRWDKSAESIDYYYQYAETLAERGEEKVLTETFATMREIRRLAKQESID